MEAVQELGKDDDFRGSIISSKGADFQEALLVDFLRSDHELHHRYGAILLPAASMDCSQGSCLSRWSSYGASCIAREVDTPLAKSAVAKLGGTKLLVQLLKKYHNKPGSRLTTLALLHAILNMTTFEKNQEIVGKAGTGFISWLVTLEDQPDVSGFAARIIKNLSRLGTNRSRLYK